MGACGCSDGHGDYRLPSPPGRVVTIGVYLGCSYCGTGVAVDIRTYDREEAEEWGLLDLPEVDLGRFELAGYGMWSHEIISPKAFREAIQKHVATDYDEWEGRETYDTMADMVVGTGKKK